MSQDDVRPPLPNNDTGRTEAAAVREVSTSPPAVITVETQPIASLGDRLVAQLVDGLLAFGLLFLIASALVPRLGGLEGLALDTRLLGAAVALGIATLILLPYFILGEALLGLTLGKAAAGIRVRSKEGGGISGRAAFIRNLIRPFEALTLYLISALAILVTKRGQRIGDLLAGTVVVKHEAARPLRALALVLAMLIAFGGAAGGLAINSLGPAPIDRIALPPSPQPGPSGRPRIVNAIVTGARTSDVNQSSFPPQTPEIFVRFTLADVAPGSQLRAVWIAEQVAGIRSGFTMGESPTSEVGGTQNQGVFPHARPPNGWPSGTYRVDLYLNGDLERTVRFTVDPAMPTLTTVPGATPQATVEATPGGTPRTVPGALPTPTPLPPRTI
jgi:uncharacterized RDD family membrane protein YckC